MAQATLTRIKTNNLLSFGPEGIDLELPALTVLIGPNGSGKSNLLEMVGLLRAAPMDLAQPIRTGGGIHNWIWRGSNDLFATAVLEATLAVPGLQGDTTHMIEFMSMRPGFAVSEEKILSSEFISFKADIRRVWERSGPTAIHKNLTNGTEESSEDRKVASDKSILSEVKDSTRFPELWVISNFYEAISLYRRWEFGPNAAIRQPQLIDVKPSPLLEDFSNLGMFLNRIRQHPRAKTELFEKLGDIYSGVRDFELNIEGGTVQVFFTEGEFSIPATRLSDGSLRYLCLLAILLDPDPPPLICIEEPELGFHPDLVPKLADLLVDASNRCQLIVTTHSDALVDALSDRPESVVVCDKHDGQTTMSRLDRSDLSVWLEKYRLGELWTMGELGGVRW